MEAANHRFIFWIQILFICWFLNHSLLSQQNFTLKNFTTENGLPNNKVRYITQDQTGFLWIATFDGLSRYDGYEFKNYYHIPGDSTSIPYFIIFKLCVDRKNNVWIHTEYGTLCRYNRATDNFIQLPIYSDDNRQKQYINDIALDSKKNLWIKCSNVLYRYDNELGILIKYNIVDSNNNQRSKVTSPISFIIDNYDHIWLIGEKTYKCMVVTKNKSGVVQIQNSYQLNKSYTPTNLPMTNDALNTIYESPGKYVWLLTPYNLFRLDTIKKEFNVYQGDRAKNEFIYSFPMVWGRIGAGLTIEMGNKKMIQIPEKTCQNPISVFVDNNHSIWFGSVSESGYGLGLTRYIETPSFFRHPLFEKQNYYTKLSIFSVLKDKNGTVWTGSRGYNYLFQINHHGTVTSINKLSPYLNQKSSHIRSMMEDTSGIWLGYNTNLLMHFNSRSGRFEKMFLNHFGGNEIDTPWLVHALFPGKSGKILIGSISLFQYEVNSKKIEKVWKSTDNAPIYAMNKDKNGNIWIGKASDDLIQLNSQFQKINSFKLCNERYNVESICPGDNNDLWVALYGGGICHLNLTTGKSEILTTASGLSNNTTYSILKDKT